MSIDEDFQDQSFKNMPGGKPPKKDDDEDKDEVKDENKILMDDNLIRKTFAGAMNLGAKIKGQISDDDTVGVGKTKIVIPDFMKTYSQMFVDSEIMEAIIPRKLTNADQLRDFNPFLLDEEEDYEFADFDGINDVSDQSFLTTVLGLP